jgi:hypothetical protein
MFAANVVDVTAGFFGTTKILLDFSATLCSQAGCEEVCLTFGA